MQDAESIAITESSGHCGHDAVIIEKPGVFIPDDVAQVFCADFFRDDICRAFVISRLHPNGGHCPECGAHVPEKFQDRFQAGNRLKCSCGKFFTMLTGTFLSGCQLNFREVVLLAILLSLDISEKVIAGYLGMTPENIRIWRTKFKALEKLRSIKAIKNHNGVLP